MVSRSHWIVAGGQLDGPHDEALLARRLAAGDLSADVLRDRL